MLTYSLRTRLASLALGATLILPWSAGAESARQAPMPRAERALSTPSDLLPRVWSLLVNVWAEAGCIIDPDGCARSQTAGLVPADAGCGLDPNGCARSQAVAPAPADEGCMIDPNGCH